MAERPDANSPPDRSTAPRGRITRFEDLVVWQKARDLSLHIYRVTGDGRFSKDFALKDQIRRAAISVMSNIAEGFERYSRPEFRQFLAIARGSAAEVRCQLYLARDLQYLEPEEFDHLRNRYLEVSKMLAGLRASMET